jgi:hypothetical protein
MVKMGKEIILATMFLKFTNEKTKTKLNYGIKIPNK